MHDRAARIATNSAFDSSAASLIQELGWPTVRELFHRETSVMAYKCLIKLIPEYLSGFHYKLCDYHPCVLGNSETGILIPRMKTFYGQKFFAFRGAKEWNNLDPATKSLLKSTEVQYLELA